MSLRILNILLCFCLVSSAAQAQRDVYVSRHAVKVLPARILSIPAPESGEIRIHSFGKGRVAEGTLLAVLNEELLNMDERELGLTLRQQRIERDKALYKLQKQKEELEFLRKLPEARREFAQERMKTRVDEQMLVAIDEEIELLHERYRLSENKAQQVFDKRREACTLRMPFDGRLQYHISLPGEEGGSVPVAASTPVVTVVDDSAIYVAMLATDPVWSRLEHGRLHLSIDLGGGEKLCARWHHMKVEKGERDEALFYYFLVPEAEKERAFLLIGSNIVAELFYEAEESWLYERKSKLAMEAGPTPIETWEKLIEALRPGYEVVFIGETHICLRKKDERTVVPAPVPAS